MKKGWALKTYTQNDRIAFVVILPVRDIREHWKTDLKCDCIPKVEIENGVLILTHNAFDGREAVEEAALIMQSVKKGKA